jgi:formylglycine-generating enzyme required for sulfatase activity
MFHAIHEIDRHETASLRSPFLSGVWICAIALFTLTAAVVADPGMVQVPAGTFTMGDGVAPCGVDEHEVTLTRGFLLGQHQVTNQEYLEVLQWAYDQGHVTATTSTVQDNLDGSTEEILDLDDEHCEIQFDGVGTFSLRESPSNYAQDAYPGGYDPSDHPVKEVTWYGAARYCDWLSLQAGLPRAYEHTGDWSCNGGDPYGAEGYRLPTDAEWEYAARFNDGRLFPWGDEPPDCSRVNFQPDSYCVGWTSPVGSYQAAPEVLGLSDMAGNVFDWCNDWHVCDLGTAPATDPTGPSSGTYRVLRGGSWHAYDGYVRCASRTYDETSESGDSTIGLRVARTDPGPQIYSVQPDGGGDYPTIQAAVDAAYPGDTVELMDGTYTGDGNRDIDFHGKAVTVRSQSGNPEDCIIDCEGSESEPHRGFYFHSGEGPDSVVEGITITNGYAEDGGGISCQVVACSPTINDCILTGNHAYDDGGGLRVSYGSPEVRGCIISNNTAEDVGGGVHCLNASPKFADCEIVDNTSLTNDGGGLYLDTESYVEFGTCTVSGNTVPDKGGALFCGGASYFLLWRCIVVGNTAGVRSGGLHLSDAGEVVVFWCTFYGNEAPEGAGLTSGGTSLANVHNTIIASGIQGEAIYCQDGGSVDVVCCDLFDNEGGDWVGCVAGQNGHNGNISEDPLFCDAENGDFTLHSDSPCDVMNNMECGQIGAWGVGCGPSSDAPELDATPARIALRSIHPNPGFSAFTVAFDLPKTQEVVISVFDVAGRRVKRLVQGSHHAGRHEVAWLGTDEMGHQAARGIYFVSMKTGDFEETRKLTVVK